MLLAIDTATRWTGLALYDGLAVLAEWGWRCQNTQTIELAPAVHDLVARARVEMADLKAVAVAVGPGSYTGLRVGLGFAKGLALGLTLPLIGIPTLTIVAAAQAPASHPLIAIAEAGRTRLLAGRFHHQAESGWLVAAPAQVQTVAELAASLSEPTLLAGELSAATQAEINKVTELAHFAPPSANVRRAGILAELAWARLARGDVDDAATLVPDYLRPPAGA